MTTYPRRTLAHFADQHVRLGPRFAEGQRIHRVIAGILGERRPDAILLGGDWHDAGSRPEERVESAELLLALAAVAPIAGVYGNHDVPHDLDVYNDLARPGTHPIRFFYEPAIWRCGDVAVAMLPWLRDAPALDTLRLTPAERRAAEQAALRARLTALGDALEATGAATRLCVAHCMLREANPAKGQPERRGRDFDLGLDDLALVRAHAYLLGHVHASQSWAIDTVLPTGERISAPVFYPGSTTRRTYGEIERKRISLVHCAGPHVEIEYVELPVTPMVLVEARWAETSPGVWGWAGGVDELVADAAGADVRFTYSVPVEQREAAARAKSALASALYAAGAERVSPEERLLVETRARAPEIARTPSIEGKLAIALDAKGCVEGSAQHERVIAMFREMMADVTA